MHLAAGIPYCDSIVVGYTGIGFTIIDWIKITDYDCNFGSTNVLLPCPQGASIA